MQDRHAKNPGRVLITPEDGAPAYYAVVSMADNADVPGTPLNKATLLSDDAERAIFGAAANRTVNDALKALPAMAWKLIDKIDNTRGMSGTWTAPNFNGDGSAYDIGVYMIGGGGSGYAWSNGGEFRGGSAGFGKNFVEKVTPGKAMPWVIGAGGKPGRNGYEPGNAGGTTSFNGKTVSGGSGGASSGVHPPFGGQISDKLLTLRDYGNLQFSPIGGSLPYGDTEYLTQSPRESQNAFDSTMITLSAGGSFSNKFRQDGGILPDGTHGGNAANYGQSATGYGNGGGSGQASCGSGSDGVIFIYARRATQ